MREKFDAIIIGAGQAGPSLAKRYAKEGRRTAIIERHLFGGTCVNTGCIPTKTLIASARAAYIARGAADFGVVIDAPIRVDMGKIKARKDGIVAKSSNGVEQSLKRTPNLTVIKGHARFESARTVVVNDAALEADAIFVNVGARALIPDMPGVRDVPYLTNSSMMAVDFLPQHLVIVGGSYVGLEFAQMYRRFGSAVTVVEMGPRLIAREDDAISDGVTAMLEAEGIAVRLNAKCVRLAAREDGVDVNVECAQEPRTVNGSHVLLAVGRKPNTDDLGLDRAGVKTDERGYIVVDDALRTSVPGIWALGEVNGRGGFTHTSYNDYEIVAANIFDGGSRRVTDRITAYALYTDPPLGRAGMTEREVRASGRKALVATLDMSDVARATERGETQGAMRIVVDAESRRILGAAILGIEGDEVIHCLLDVMYAQQPYTLFQRAVHIHPTVAEFLPTLLEDLKPL